VPLDSDTVDGRWIAHLDMDAFYVSVEMQRRPHLANRPVVVCANTSRAVVTAANYQARKFGIYSATPAERARRLCPEATFVEPDFQCYRQRSAQIMELISQYVDNTEAAGLDEAYLDLSGLERPRAGARKLKSDVFASTGLNASVGLGPNKLIAKVASAACKPDGFLMLTQQQALARFAGLSCKALPGIGPKTAQRLSLAGIETVEALRALDPVYAASVFGPKTAVALRRLAMLEDDRPLEPNRRGKSESRETTFEYDLEGVEALEPVVRRLGGQVCADLASHNRQGRTITVKVKLTDFSVYTRSRTLVEPTNEFETVATVASSLLRAFDLRLPVRLVGVCVGGLEESYADQEPQDPASQLRFAL
jgi:DNA polymerase IV